MKDPSAYGLVGRQPGKAKAVTTALNVNLTLNPTPSTKTWVNPRPKALIWGHRSREPEIPMIQGYGV